MFARTGEAALGLLSPIRRPGLLGVTDAVFGLGDPVSLSKISRCRLSHREIQPFGVGIETVEERVTGLQLCRVVRS